MRCTWEPWQTWQKSSLSHPQSFTRSPDWLRRLQLLKQMWCPSTRWVRRSMEELQACHLDPVDRKCYGKLVLNAQSTVSFLCEFSRHLNYIAMAIMTDKWLCGYGHWWCPFDTLSSFAVSRKKSAMCAMNNSVSGFRIRRRNSDKCDLVWTLKCVQLNWMISVSYSWLWRKFGMNVAGFPYVLSQETSLGS